ncbi:MAG: CPBP family intramembrane glutamic endopeptidase [Bacteroidia bacterium]
MIREPKAIGRLAAVTGVLLFNCALMLAGSFVDIPQDLTDPHVLLMDKISQVLSVLLIFVLPSLLIGFLMTRSGIRFLGLGLTVKPVYYLLALVLIFCALPLVNALAELNKHMVLPSSLKEVEDWMRSSEDKAGKLTEAMLKSAGMGDLILNLFTVAFMAAVSEELFFRGLVQNVCREWFKNYHVAIWITAFIFSAFHMEFYGFLPRMLLGLGLGYLYVWSGSIYISMLAHFTNNAIGVIGVYLVEHKFVTEDPATPASSGSNLIVTGVSVVLSGALIYYAWRIRKREEAVVPAVADETEYPGVL